MSRHRRDPGTDAAHEIIDQCIAGRVRQISRVITAHYDEELREFGITANQLTILSVVAVLERVSPSAMRPYLLMDASTVSRNVQRMIENGWLRTVPGQDARSHDLVLAPEGRLTLERAQPAWRRAHEWALGAIGGDGAAAVRRIARRINPLVPE